MGSKDRIYKFPRTHHIQGSRFQSGDENLKAVRLADLKSHHLVVAEKYDGANSAISFESDGTLLLQSRGHYLSGGPRERHFALLKTWAHSHRQMLWERLGARYVMYGEWMYAKHTIFYDALPHYFLEFDILDKEQERFLSTTRRQMLLDSAPIVSVRVVGVGRMERLEDLEGLIGASHAKGPHWRKSLDQAIAEQGLERDQVLRETDPSDLMEGLYVKAEDEETVVGRYKFVRAGFLSAVTKSESHWQDRAILPNRLLNHVVDVFAR